MFLQNSISGNTEDDLKRQCIALIVYVLCIVLCIYSIIAYFILDNRNFALATFIYLILLLYTFLLVRKTYNIKLVVHLYLILDPLFDAFIMLYFWKYSDGMALWVLPIPIGAYVFLEKKYIYIYTAYILLMVGFVTFLNEILTIHTPLNFNKPDISDALVGSANIIIVMLLLYYNDKIKSAKITIEFEEYKNSEVVGFTIQNDKNYNTEAPKVPACDKDIDKYIEIFRNVKNVVEEQLCFKDADFTISHLSHMIKINNLYITKAIKLCGYSSFCHYINFCRIQYVKKLINENGLSKVTLMYIYTSSGFISQSTFNRVFKQVEGITPTEYIYNLQKKIS